MAEWNRETPWRQGHLLGENAVEALGLRHATAPDQTLIIVVTHDCDLAQAPDTEPVIEVVVGRRVENGNGNCTHAKNARKLHVEFAHDVAFWGEFEATAKVSIDKLKLNGFEPRADVQLSPDKKTTLQKWLSSRYRRSAFPDEFDRRLKDETLADKITKAVRPHGELISGVFFDVDEGREVKRVGPDDIYVLDVYLLHPDEPDYQTAFNAAQQAAEKIQTAFTNRLFNPTKTWQHIELRSCEVLSESALTYQQFKQLKQWPFDYISLAADPQQPLLQE